MNISRLYSCLYKQNYLVGRVQTPTLSIIADRDNEIFRPYHLLVKILSKVPESEAKVYKLISNKLHASVGYPLV